MIDLHPCPGCRRHVTSTEASCPFCSHTLLQRGPRDTGFGRMSRAMIFASATLTSAACGGRSKPPMEQHHGGGGCFPADQAEVERLEKQRAAAETEADKHALDAQIERAKMPVCMPYGAPPARRRQV